MVEDGDGQAVEADPHTEGHERAQQLAEQQIAQEDVLGAGVGQGDRFIV